jgi:hypothetical protein
MSFPLAQVLAAAPGVKKDDRAFLLSEESEATLFLTLGQEVLMVARLARVEIDGETLSLLTHKGERFWFEASQVRGFRAGSAESRGARSSAGFLKTGGA